MDVTLIISYGLTAALLAYAWRVLPAGRLRWTGLIMLALMASYELFDVPDGSVYLWLRHTPFYFGEFFFYWFLVQFGRRYIESPDAADKQQQSYLLVPVFLFSTTTSLVDFLTDQGLPHILTLPIYLLIVAIVRLKFSLNQSPYLRIANWLTWAVGLWVMEHVTEFILESQKLVPAINEKVESIETFWFWLGIGVFFVILRRFQRLSHE
jgi:hypothetical protein